MKILFYKTVFIVLFLSFSISCVKKEKNAKTDYKKDSRVSHKKVDNTTKEILCDSVYKGKKYEIILNSFSQEQSYDEKDRNTVFSFRKMINGKYKEIFQDSIESHFRSFQFQDFNGDNIKDILIENISDVRSNLTYYLYLVDSKNDKLVKIKGFNQIKNPHYLPKYDLIDNEVMSGREWTSFYQIKNDSIYDFGYVIYKGEDDNGNILDFEKEYNETLSKILKDKHYH